MEFPGIFHIGFPKTGSTTLQAFLRADPRIQMLYKPGFFASDRWYTERYPELDPERTPIETDEAVMRQFSKGRRTDIRTVLERIARSRPDAHIVLFIREQSSILLSEYKHHTKVTFDPYDFGAYLNSPTGQFFRNVIAYDRTVKDVLAHFPQERVHIYLYEEMKADPNAFIGRFYKELFGSEPPELELGKKAEGIPPSVVRLKRGLNRRKIFRKLRWADHIDRVILNGLFKVLYPIWPKKGTNEELYRECPYFDRIIEEYGDNNARLMELTGLPLKEYGYKVAPESSLSEKEE